ncbi:MAG: NADH-quinone oxidoreductase subunit B family protein [Bryobacteraceae bacterium]
MANWTLASLVRGIRTTRWPSRDDIPPGAMPLRLDGTTGDGRRENRLRGADGAISPGNAAWTFRTLHSQGPLPRRFRHSVHVRFVDAGANGACISEVRLIDAPPYNLHRFGIFITASPRDADVLLVAGPVTEAMRAALRKAYDAMATPRRVVAIGDEAIDGGVFGKSFASAGGVHEVIPVDFIVPGCPPPPLAIIHGLLAAAGQITVPQAGATP